MLIKNKLFLLNWEKIGLLLILILALILRLIPALRLEFWLDEGLNFFTREQTFTKLLTYDSLHPPMYFWLIKIWSQLGTFEFFLRLPSLIFSLLTFFLIFGIAKTIRLNKYFPLLATLLYSVSILNIDLSFQVRMYSMVTFWMILSFLIFVKIIYEKNNNKYFIPFCLVNFFGIITDYAFIWYFLSVIIGYLLILLLNKLKVVYFPKKFLAYLWRVLLTSGILMLAWLPFFLTNFNKALNVFYSPPSSFDAIKGIFLTDNGESNGFTEFAFFFIFLLTNIANIFLLFKSLRDKKGKQFLFWIIIFLFFHLSVNSMGFLSLIIGRLVATAYRLIVATFFPIFSLAGLISLFLTKNKYFMKLIGIFLLVFIVAINGNIIKNHYFYKARTFWNSYSYKDAAEFVSRYADLKKDTIFFLPNYYFGIFDYYFYEYNLGKNNAKKYILGWPDYVKNINHGKTYWLVNIQFNFIDKQDETYKYFFNCNSINHPIYYKKAVIYKCQI